MQTVYFDTLLTNMNLLSKREKNEIQYYLDLLIKETKSCFKSNSINCDKSKVNSKHKIAKLNLEIDADSKKELKVKIIFNEGNPESKRLSTIIFENIKKIYYDPSKVMIISIPQNENTSKQPITKIIFENFKNLNWIIQNIENFSKELVMSFDEYFGLPFVFCEICNIGIANSDAIIMDRPNLNANIIGNVESNNKINIYGQWEDWYIVSKDNNLGFVETKFIEI